MSEQPKITREQLEEIVAEAVRDYMPGRKGSKFIDFFRGKGGRFRQSGGDGDNEKEDPFGRKKKPTDTDTSGKEAPPGEKAKAGDSGKEQGEVGYPGTEEDGEKPKAKPSPEKKKKKKKKKKKGSSLKRIPGPELQKTLNQLRNKGISGEKIGALFDKAADEISKGAAAAPSIRRDFEQKDRPLINMMRDQVVAILNGNFASLKEGKIHNGTIAFFKEIIK